MRDPDKLQIINENKVSNEEPRGVDRMDRTRQGTKPANAAIKKANLQRHREVPCIKVLVI